MAPGGKQTAGTDEHPRNKDPVFMQMSFVIKNKVREMQKIYDKSKQAEWALKRNPLHFPGGIQLLFQINFLHN